MNLSSLLTEFSARIDVRMHIPLADALDVRTDVYETGKDGVIVRGGDQVHSQTRTDGQALVALSRGGHGPLIDLFASQVRKSTESALGVYGGRRLVQRIDAALFALDHDGGHGPNVEGAVRELWALSGPDTWAAYAAKRTQVLRWLEVFAQDPVR